MKRFPVAKDTIQLKNGYQATTPTSHTTDLSSSHNSSARQLNTTCPFSGHTCFRTIPSTASPGSSAAVSPELQLLLERLNPVVSGGGRVLPGALDVQEDCVGVVGEQKTSNQTKHPACNEGAVASSSDHADQRRDDVKSSTNGSADEIAPQPVDHLDLLVQLHHEDDEEDDGEDHFADGHGRVASIVGGGVADEDYETEDYFRRQDEALRRLAVTLEPLQEAHSGRVGASISHIPDNVVDEAKLLLQCELS